MLILNALLVDADTLTIAETNAPSELFSRLQIAQRHQHRLQFHGAVERGGAGNKQQVFDVLTGRHDGLATAGLGLLGVVRFVGDKRLERGR